METIRNTYKNAMLTIENELNRHISKIKEELKSEFIFINSRISYEGKLKCNLTKNLSWIKNNRKYDDLLVVITSSGGIPNDAYQMVLLIREGFKSVRYAIVDEALSAATILCLSADEIFITPFGKMGDLRLQINYGNFHFPFKAYIESEYGAIERSMNLSPEVKEFISHFKYKLETKANEECQQEVKDAVNGYLKLYMFKEYDSLSEDKKNQIDNITEKLTGWNYLTSIGCISHDTGIYYSRLKDDLGLKIYDYGGEKENAILATALLEFNNLMSDYFKMNCYESDFVYSEYYGRIISKESRCKD